MSHREYRVVQGEHVRRYTGFDRKIDNALIVAVVAEEDVKAVWAIDDMNQCLGSLRQYYRDNGLPGRLVGVYISADCDTTQQICGLVHG